MTDDELAEIEARAKAATNGPWRADITSVGGFVMARSLVASAYGENHGANVEFIAKSRTDVEVLSAALRESWRVFDECDEHRIECFNDLENERAAHHETDEALRVVREKLKAVEALAEDWADIPGRGRMCSRELREALSA